MKTYRKGNRVVYNNEICTIKEVCKGCILVQNSENKTFTVSERNIKTYKQFRPKIRQKDGKLNWVLLTDITGQPRKISVFTYLKIRYNNYTILDLQTTFEGEYCYWNATLEKRQNHSVIKKK